MSQLRPNVRAVLTPRNGTDKYGQPQLGDPQTILVNVVRGQRVAQHTTVRADSSASRGYANETTLNMRLLVPPTVTVKNGDKIEVAGVVMEVLKTEPRFDVFGVLDHFQIEGGPWA